MHYVYYTGACHNILQYECHHVSSDVKREKLMCKRSAGIEFGGGVKINHDKFKERGSFVHC